MFRDEIKPFIPYLAIAIELSKKNCDYQKALNFAKELTQASDEKICTLIDFKNKDTSPIYEALSTVIQIYSATHGDIDETTPPFVYEDIPLNERLSSKTFLEIRDKAAVALLNMNLSIQQKVGVLTAFQFISKSDSSKGEFGTASQLESFRKNAWEYLTDALYFEEYGFHIKETVQKMMAERNLLIMKDYLANLNAINHAATLAYQKLDEHYAQLLANSIQKIRQEFKRAKKKAIRKAVKNFEIGIAAMVATACVAPYVSAFVCQAAEVGAMTGMEVLLTSAAIDAIAYSAVSTGAEAILNNNFKGFHKNFLQRVAIGFSTRLTGSLMAANSSTPIVKGSAEAIKISAATSAVKSALQSILKNGKLDDAVKGALLGGITGATTEKLTSIFNSFEIDGAMNEIVKGAVQDGLHAGVQTAIFAIDKKNHTNTNDFLIDIFLVALASYIAGNIQRGIKNVAEKIKEDEPITETHAEPAPSQVDEKPQPATRPDSSQQIVSNSSQNMRPPPANQVTHSKEKQGQQKQEMQQTPKKQKIPRGGTQFNVPNVGVGTKPGRGGLRFFDIGDGRYIDKKQLSQKMLSNNKTRDKLEFGIALAHKFPPKEPRIYWLAEQQFGNENINVRPIVVGDGQTYFQAKFNPSTGQFRIELSANKNIRLNLASGEYDVGFAKLDYAVNAAEAFALAKATLSTKDGLKAGIDLGVAVLGPNVTYSVQSPNQYSILGLTFSGEISGQTGYGAGIEGGVGLTVDKTQPRIRFYSKLGVFLGWGAKVTNNIIVGLNQDSSVFDEVRNSPERKMIYDSIKEARKQNNESNPTSFFGLWTKIAKEQGLDELETERYEIDGNIAAGKLRIAPVSK